MSWTTSLTWTSPPPAPALGTVYLVGAGPGDPELITVRGLRCLRRADVVLFDRLVHPDLLDEAPPEALRIFVGKAPGRPGLGQAEIERRLIDHARRGRTVVRLKGGDPFVFGRGSEEAAALTGAGVPWDVVPAVSSAFGVPARAHIPLTHRGLARSFAVVTAHQVDGGGPDWAALAAIDTLVVLMGVATLPAVSRELVRHGRDPATPVAVIARGTLPDQKVLTGTLADIAERVDEACLRPPATIVIGEVVALRDVLDDGDWNDLTDAAPAVSAPAPDPYASPTRALPPHRAAAGARLPSRNPS